jgi:hypothetical protein
MIRTFKVINKLKAEGYAVKVSHRRRATLSPAFWDVKRNLDPSYIWELDFIDERKVYRRTPLSKEAFPEFVHDFLGKGGVTNLKLTKGEQVTDVAAVCYYNQAFSYEEGRREALKIAYQKLGLQDRIAELYSNE